MTTFQQTMTAFWSQFSAAGKQIPAYIAGMVPSGAAFPYITFDVSINPPFSSGLGTAHVWLRREKGASPIPTCAAILDDIARAIPAAGVRVPVGSGCFVLYRNDATWQSYVLDPEDPDVLGGRISYQINYYL